MCIFYFTLQKSTFLIKFYIQNDITKANLKFLFSRLCNYSDFFLFQKRVVRTSQSGLIPDLPIPDPVQGSHPGPLVGISNLIPDTVDLINPELTRRSKLQNRTSKSGLLFDPPEYSESLNSLLGTPPSALPEANSGRRKDEEGRRKEDDGRRVKDKKADDINLKSFIHTSS